jgi:hypothetical protein
MGFRMGKKHEGEREKESFKKERESLFNKLKE